MVNTDIGFYLRKLNNHIQKHIYSLYSRRENNECSLSNLLVIDYLMDNTDRDIYQKDIEAEFAINRATASKMLTLMEEKKFILRSSSAEDGRLKKIEVLPEGAKLRKICESIKKEMEQELTASLSKEEVVFLKKILRKMLAHFE